MPIFKNGRKIKASTELIINDQKVEVGVNNGGRVGVFIKNETGGGNGLYSPNPADVIGFLSEKLGKGHGILDRQPRKGDFEKEVWGIRQERK